MNDLPSSATYPLFSKRHSDSKSWTTARFGGTVPGSITRGVINFFKDVGGHYTNGAASKAVGIGEWIHLVFVKDTNTLVVYQNGILASSVTDTRQISGSDMNMYFGRQGAWNAYFRGKMDDVGIWNRALTPGEVEQLFN